MMQERECSNGFGHMTKMDSTPIYGKKQKANVLGTWYVQ